MFRQFEMYDLNYNCGNRIKKIFVIKSQYNYRYRI